MDLTPDTIDKIVHPTAAFIEPTKAVDESLILVDLPPEGNRVVAWSESELNPKNRIDSLGEVLHPRWKIDGSAGMGTQFYTIPLFFKRLTPVRIDTFIPEQSIHSPALRKLLDLDTAFHCRDSRVSRLGISRHILRALEHWTTIFPGFEAVYYGLPFGSRIVFENLARDVRDIRIRIVQTHDLERQLMSLATLRTLWKNSTSFWPQIIDISQVKLRHQLHDSISLVQISHSRSPETFILKALTSYPKYLYHELKILLSLPPHPNIISRPHHIVTKRCSFGNKTAVIGFTTEYHPRGTLRDVLPLRSLHGTLRIADQLKWAIQLTSALAHIREHGRFYSDLRLDNILLSDEDDVVMVDFEQRGVWCEFAAPEVNYLDYVFMLSVDAGIPTAARAKYRGLLQRYFPRYKTFLGNDYGNPEHGYSIPWLCLDSKEQEAAEVYMLGRVLWCIFEGLSSPETAVWQSYQHESELQFPAYRRTPARLRTLINKCTRGRKEWGRSAGGVVRKGNRLVLKDGDGTETKEEVQTEATKWWKGELAEAEEFLRVREHRKETAEPGHDFGRPKLLDVLETLCRLQAGNEHFERLPNVCQEASQKQEITSHELSVF